MASGEVSVLLSPSKMNILLKKYGESHIDSMVKIWNDVVVNGIAFPQEDTLDYNSGKEFFASQSYCGVAVNEDTGEVMGMYILHPNNVGRCGHIANASYCVSKNSRNLHIGEKLVTDSLAKGKELGFRILQFNAVVKTNSNARHLYEKLGFIQLGTIKGGFRMKDGHYEDICPYYKEL